MRTNPAPAMGELRARGIHYLLVSDIEDDPEAWGLQVAAAGYGIRLYRVAQ